MKHLIQACKSHQAAPVRKTNKEREVVFCVLLNAVISNNSNVCRELSIST